VERTRHQVMLQRDLDEMENPEQQDMELWDGSENDPTDAIDIVAVETLFEMINTG